MHPEVVYLWYDFRISWQTLNPQQGTLALRVMGTNDQSAGVPEVKKMDKSMLSGLNFNLDVNPFIYLCSFVMKERKKEVCNLSL